MCNKVDVSKRAMYVTAVIVCIMDLWDHGPSCHSHTSHNDLHAAIIGHTLSIQIHGNVVDWMLTCLTILEVGNLHWGCVNEMWWTCEPCCPDHVALWDYAWTDLPHPDTANLLPTATLLASKLKNICHYMVARYESQVTKRDWLCDTGVWYCCNGS